MGTFDYCVITAANQKQAKTFNTLIQKRLDASLYPREIDFRVYPDPEKGRIGSGGGTISALLHLLDDLDISDLDSFFSHNRIVMLHAGGESRRLPVYAAEAKLFAPLPVPSNSIIPPVVLDIQLNLFLDYPWHDGELLVGSGDVMIDFDTNQVPHNRGDICGFSKAATVHQGSRHGVYQFDSDGRTVKDFFQKMPEDFLLRNAAFEGTDECALDIGLVSASPKFTADLVRLISSTLDKVGSIASMLKSGDVYIDLYSDVLTACVSGIESREYLDRTQKSPLDESFRQTLFHHFTQYSLRGVLTYHSSFLHFGTLHEYPEACRAVHDQNLRPFYETDGKNAEISPRATSRVIAFNGQTEGVDLHTNGETLYLENCGYIELKASGSNILSGVTDLKLSQPLPFGMCIDQRKIGTEIIRAVYGINDTFTPCASVSDLIFCNQPIDKWLIERGLEAEQLWESAQSPDLITAKLYSADLGGDFLEGYWETPEDAAEWKKAFLGNPRYSLRELNDTCDVLQREQERVTARASLLRQRVLSGKGWTGVSKADFSDVFAVEDEPALKRILDKTDDQFLKVYRHTLLSSISENSPDGIRLGNIQPLSFSLDKSTTAALAVSVKPDQIVWARCPLRFDLAGGWTDTPPYTNKFGGTVVNMAVDLNGQPPVQVFVRPTKELHIRIHSIDLGVTETYTKAAQILEYMDPSSAFSLPKAALRLLGLVDAQKNETLMSQLERLGSGIEITLLCAVPKGSGLGTSSILGAAILAALQRFFGISATQSDLFLQVLEMEQMLTTGGGWQDQIGGVEGGIKYLFSKPGLIPDIKIHQLDTFLFADGAMRQRYTLYYTGITRLAKNILQEIARNVNCASPAYLFTHRILKELAEKTKEAISLRDYPGLCSIIKDSWSANKLIHPSSTNDEVEAILRLAEPYISGMKLLGAGGGGYALFASESLEKADQLKHVLSTSNPNSGARVVDFDLSVDGLKVTVS